MAEITILAGSSCPSLRVDIGKSRCVSNCLVAGGEGSIGTAEGLLRVSRRDHWEKHGKTMEKPWKILRHIGYKQSHDGSMVLGIYANIGGILMGSMLPYIAAPWILWELSPTLAMIWDPTIEDSMLRSPISEICWVPLWLGLISTSKDRENLRLAPGLCS